MVHGESTQERWNSLEHSVKNAAEKACGRSKEGKKRGGEKWWWNEQVAEVIKTKKRGIKNGGKTGVKRIWKCIRC